MIKDEDKAKGHLLKELATLRRRIAELEAVDGEDKRTEKTAHPQHMLLALSQASQAVQRARIPEAVQDAIGEQVVRLGLDATVLVLNDDRTHLHVASHIINPHLVRATKRLTGLSAKGYRFPLTPGGFHHRILASGETTFIHQGIAPLAHILPRAARPLAAQLMGLFDWPQSIVAPLPLGRETQSLLAISGSSLTEADMPPVTSSAHQAAIAMNNARLYQAERDTQERLCRLISDLQDAREEERKRMTRKIHDEFGQTLANVARHTGASEVHVELATDRHRVVLRVRDDGRGITQREISSPQSLGLLGMRERTRMLSGEITFEGVQGQETTVTVCCGRNNDPRAGRR